MARQTKETVAVPTTMLYVKNMVCDRCIRVVREELTKLGLDVRSVTLGEVVLSGEPSQLPLQRIRTILEENGFSLIEDRKAKIIERVKLAIVELIHHGENAQSRKTRFSEYLARKIGYDYHYLSSLFSSVENVTIEHFIILQRIERAKELLKYGELTLSEIAFRLGYSSVQHLSSQFKNVTGMTPSRFKSLQINTRKPLDRVR